MVKGEWIVMPHEMRCKNWVNGLEFTFSFNEKNMIEGTITAIPPEILKKFSMPQLIIYLLRMWRQAATGFKKAYYKKYGLPKLERIPVII